MKVNIFCAHQVSTYANSSLYPCWWGVARRGELNHLSQSSSCGPSLRLFRTENGEVLISVTHFYLLPGSFLNPPFISQTRINREEKKMTVSLLPLMLILLFCSNSHVVPLSSLWSFWPPSLSLTFLCWLGPLPIILGLLLLVSPGSAIPTLLSPQPTLCTWSPPSRSYISVLDCMKAEALCRCQTFRDLPESIFCCFLWSWTLAFLKPLEILPLPRAPSLALPGQLHLGHPILAVKFTVLVLLLLN